MNKHKQFGKNRVYIVILKTNKIIEKITLFQYASDTAGLKTMHSCNCDCSASLENILIIQQNESEK